MPSPRIPILLGAAGLIPFLAAAAALAWLPEWQAVAVRAITVYGFVILAFLGGVHWGIGLRTGRVRDFVWAVIPSLMAFFSAFAAAPVTLALLSAAFVVVGAYDIAVFRRTGPQWYVRLRVALTAIVASTLAGAAFALS